MVRVPDTGYLVAVMVIVFAITLALRALPFAILTPLRESEFVQTMALWMPVGILAILAVATFRSSAFAGAGHLPAAIIAVGVTTAAHLLLGRRTLLSVGLGTLTLVLLVNLP